MSEHCGFQFNTLDDTREFARRLAELLSNKELGPMTVCFNGTLGAGKTQCIRFVVEALGVPAEDVTSPTYVLLQRYAGAKVCYHFDFYRLRSEAEVWDLCIDELFESDCLVFVEWAELFPSCLPEDFLNIELSTYEDSQTGRRAKLTSNGPRSLQVLQALEDSS
ncbi:MAG: tRNA (adenosine(37)-N6)-threonylcarbamoyltransferase complex ATPase subunit type 1 TsaE [Planctomycetota bacterium]